MTPKKTRGYGWVPDLPDRRDYAYARVAPKPRALPPRIDLRAACSAVENQGQLGSCTANALAGALEYLERKDGVSFEDVSRLFIYYNERAIEGTIAQDSGAMLRDGVKSLAASGVCSETRWPYVLSKFSIKPSAACYRDARAHRITAYARLETLDDMRGCLADGFPFVFGFTVYESFESAAVARSGVMSMPKRGERTLGGHAVLGVGYDDGAKRLLVRNSWGTIWGQAGYFWMPYAYLTNRGLSDDFWTLRRAAGF